MNDFQSKPIDPPSLVRIIRRLVEERRNGVLPVELLHEDPEPLAKAANSTPGATAWASIPGIDMAAAKQHLSGDWNLFLSILKRLSTEFIGLTLPAASEPDESARSAIASRMHKLRGSASAVGALEVQQRAKAAEAGLREPGTLVVPLLQSVADALNALIQATAPVLAAEEDRQSSRELPAHVLTLSPSQRDELTELLRQHDLEALERIEEWEMSLRLTLGPATVGQLLDAVNALDFDAAYRILTS